MSYYQQILDTHGKDLIDQLTNLIFDYIQENGITSKEDIKKNILGYKPDKYNNMNIITEDKVLCAKELNKNKNKPKKSTNDDSNRSVELDENIRCGYIMKQSKKNPPPRCNNKKAPGLPVCLKCSTKKGGIEIIEKNKISDDFSEDEIEEEEKPDKRGLNAQRIAGTPYGKTKEGLIVLMKENNVGIAVGIQTEDDNEPRELTTEEKIKYNKKYGINKGEKEELKEFRKIEEENKHKKKKIDLNNFLDTLDSEEINI